MEPVTHLLTGAVLSRAGFNRKAAYATVAMIIAAELPDGDSVALLGGPIVNLEHHRGITHTLVAMPFEAALLTAAFYLLHRLLGRPQRKADVNWAWLYGGCLLAGLSHILLDWTNNYGVRPFFPFDPHWYAGSFVFIFEPVLFALLVVALIAPLLFVLIGSEIGARRRAFAGRGWAIASLLGIAALYGFRFEEHAKAVRIATENAPPETSRVFASPHPLDPFQWHVVADTPTFYQLSTVDTRTGLSSTPAPSDMLYKPPTSLALLAAKRSFVGRIYLDWAMFPVLSEAPVLDDPNHPLTEVTFSDARFMFDISMLHGRKTPPLSAQVTLDMAAKEADRIVEMKMSGREQK
jgi:inner membrane protein